VVVLHRHLENGGAELLVNIRINPCLSIIDETIRLYRIMKPGVFLGISYPMKLSARIANDLILKIMFYKFQEHQCFVGRGC
jgi:hypothetical protein